MKQKFFRAFSKKQTLFILAAAVIFLVLISFHRAPAQQSEGTGSIIISTGDAGTWVIPVIVQGYDANTQQPVNSVTLTVNLTSTAPPPPPPPPPLPSCSSFAANPTRLVVPPPAQSTLSWSCANAVSCSIDQGVGTVNPSGSVTVSPATTTIYTLSCSNSSGNSPPYTATVTVFTPGIIEQ
jgi:hypothetical protein